MALATVDYSSYFNYKLATKQITFTDSTDYVGQGTLAANVTVVAKVEAPSGIFYNNTNHGSPDIDPGVSLDSIITIALPLDGSGNVEQGLYTITLTYVDSVVAATVIDARTFTLDYTAPTVDISMTVDCVTPQLAAIDDTAYTQNAIDPTITRAFSIHYPPSLALADVTGTGSTLTTNTFYTVADQTVEHSSSLISQLSYLFDAVELMYVIDEVSGAEVIPVACDGDLCDIYCCLKTQYQRYVDIKTVNNTLAQKELAIFKEITSLAEMVGIALRCGKSTHISDYVSQILILADCDAGCACADGTPQLVTGLAVTGDTVVVAAGTGVTVGVVTGGGTTTYTVSLTTANVNKLAATYNAVVTAGTNVTSVTSSSATVSDVTTTTYVVNATDTVVESIFARTKLTFATGVVPVIAIVNQNEYGTTFQAVNQTVSTEFVLNNNMATSADWLTSYTSFTCGNFFASGTDYFPEVNLANINYSVEVPGTEDSWVSDLDVEIMAIGANSFNFRFIDKSGNPVNGTQLQNYSTIDLIFKIQA